MAILFAAAIVVAIVYAVKHTPSAVQKEVTVKSAESAQRVVLWTIAAIVLLSIFVSFGGY